MSKFMVCAVQSYVPQLDSYTWWTNESKEFTDEADFNRIIKTEF